MPKLLELTDPRYLRRLAKEINAMAGNGVYYETQYHGNKRVIHAKTFRYENRNGCPLRLLLRFMGDDLEVYRPGFPENGKLFNGTFDEIAASREIPMRLRKHFYALTASDSASETAKAWLKEQGKSSNAYAATALAARRIAARLSGRKVLEFKATLCEVKPCVT